MKLQNSVITVYDHFKTRKLNVETIPSIIITYSVVNNCLNIDQFWSHLCNMEVETETVMSCCRPFNLSDIQEMSMKEKLFALSLILTKQPSHNLNNPTYLSLLD